MGAAIKTTAYAVLAVACCVAIGMVMGVIAATAAAQVVAIIAEMLF